jgi:hypothetical protein
MYDGARLAMTCMTGYETSLAIIENMHGTTSYGTNQLAQMAIPG